ncbi:protein of unknown function; putative SAM-dependent methyltransferase domain [Modestobacter italicus]|uniref:Methyltransferase domain-containing protein n=1 Tax=Modestobacter italicus (strain DSM 44449 / CECT 9708 / BC 501) TaxID=2732864 RepID=I4EXJ9_MODI5|nr:protein of unknown function; putative SAM-dependent methyltransferase domain [Modestobacter marinus]
MTDRAVRSARRQAFRAASLVAEVLFDWRAGVRTRGRVHNESRVADLSVGGDPQGYEPANILLWWRMMRAVPVAPGSSTFVDLGAGRGRPAILAAQRGHRRVVGVELDEHLVAEAQENLRRWRSRRRPTRGEDADVVVVHGDAAAHDLPGGPLVVCVYNAFGPTTLRHVLRRVCDVPQGGTDPVFLAYLNPVHAAVVTEFPQLVLHARATRWAVYRLQPDTSAPAPG